MRQQTPREEQIRLVERWGASGDSIAVFSRAHRINRETFRSWVARERENARREPLRGFLEVVGVDAPRGGEKAEMQVAVGGFDLRFSPTPSPGWFAALLRELGPC